MRYKKIAVLLAVSGLAAPAFATNGMDLEGYGAVATAMGGASMAYDNGAGAMMNNPATLGLMPQGAGIGVALGFLGPDVKSSVPGMSAKSGGDAYYMPAAGYVRKTGQFTYGIGVYSQGGMGTEYSANSFLAQGTGDKVRSEVGVGRVIVPLAYNVNDSLTVGGSIDWVWATMDIKMAASLAQFGAMTTNMSPGMGMTMNTLVGTYGANTFRIDFSDNNDFSGKAFGSGFAGKLGFVYKINPTLSVGGTYHSKTSLGDMKTSSDGASFSAFNSGASLGPAVNGKITIHNFQWPETYGFGIAYQPTDKWMVAADYKRINWSGVMKDFKMTFSTANLGTGQTESADFKISQNWDDQNVFIIGVAYRMTDALTLRAGGNFSKNPIPDDRVHPLFPAIEENHYTVGLGYLLGKQSSLDASMTYAPKVTVTGTAATGSAGSGIGGNQGVTISHSQLNWQLQYGYHF
jgi:long-chain fatty acid transport protein